MSGFKFRFACSNANMPDNKNVFSNENGGVTFAFEFEATLDDDLFQGYQSALPQKSTSPRLNSGKRNVNGSSIIWHASRYSKFIDRISFNVEGQIKIFGKKGFDDLRRNKNLTFYSLNMDFTDFAEHLKSNSDEVYMMQYGDEKGFAESYWNE